MENQHQIAKVVSRYPLKAQKRDAAWWRSQPYIVRLAALEEIRQTYHQWRYGTEPRFQRVYRIIKRS